MPCKNVKHRVTAIDKKSDIAYNGFNDFFKKKCFFCANCRGVIMAELSKWVIPESMQDEYISNLTKMLSGLRDLMGINQSDIAKMIGVSRQTYSAIVIRTSTMATFSSILIPAM